ncbi:hypothetical protein FGB62_60g04 [Gracilaria domingensis]|nr:hypothetical protein FGB62_60g04 [Gracilaria domingensis]
MATSSTHDSSPHCAVINSSAWDTSASPIAPSGETSGAQEGPIASRLRSRRNSDKPRVHQALGQRRHRRRIAVATAKYVPALAPSRTVSNDSSDKEAVRSASRTPITPPFCFDTSLSASFPAASPTAQDNAVEGPIASRLRSRATAVKPHQTLHSGRQGRRPPAASRKSVRTQTPPTTPSPASSSQRRGRKRDASFLSGDSTVSEALRSPLAFLPDAAALTLAPTSPPPKRRRSPVAVLDRTIARALSPSLSGAWKTKLFLEQRRAMDRDSGLSLAHYASLTEAAAAGVAFSRREGFMPREVASGEAGREAQSDDSRAPAVPQLMRSEFVAAAVGGAAMGAQW